MELNGVNISPLSVMPASHVVAIFTSCAARGSFDLLGSLFVTLTYGRTLVMSLVTTTWSGVTSPRTSPIP